MNAAAAGGWSAWPAPAKLNLFLQVLGRRADGYHELQTVFQLLDWGDTVHLRLRRDGVISRVRPLPGIAEDEDLAVRAARLLAEHAGTRLGAELQVDKRIPAGGGFGGGSSDAATVLVALDALWRLDLPRDELLGLARRLGADVPVFVAGSSAWAEGVGERLTPLELGKRWYLLVDSGARIGTGELFQAPDLTRDAARKTIADFVQGRCTGNAFEAPVRARFGPVADVLDALSAFAPAQLTGTGGGCFAAFASRGQARRARQALLDRWPCRVARGVDTSPLLAARRVFTGAASGG